MRRELSPRPVVDLGAPFGEELLDERTALRGGAQHTSDVGHRIVGSFDHQSTTVTHDSDRFAGMQSELIAEMRRDDDAALPTDHDRVTHAPIVPRITEQCHERHRAVRLPKAVASPLSSEAW